MVGGTQDPEGVESAGAGATEPITLTDPDGAVTRVAPWSSWTREQVRAPGGEPALVTRLDQGQLWFSAGRRRSPWRHEVHVGPAIVSTPRGRFQAIAESDGGATISCLAGRTRVVAGLREPVLLGPDQSAAVSSDGRTLVVMDRESAVVPEAPEVIDLRDHDEAEAEREPVGVGRLAAVGASTGSTSLGAGADLIDDGHVAPTPDDEPAGDAGATRRPARLGWIPELVAIAALVMVLVAVVWVVASGGSEPETAAPAATTTAAAKPATTTSEAQTTVATTSTTPVTVATTETTLPPLAAGASAQGQLRTCRRADGGVMATVTVTHRGGPASSFDVTAALVDDSGATFATGTERSALIAPGASLDVEVLIPVDGRPTGSCELESVRGG